MLALRLRLSKVGRFTIARESSPGPLTCGHRHQRLLQLNPVPANPYVQQLSIGVGRRALAISLAVLIPALLLLMLLAYGSITPPVYREESVSVVSLPAPKVAEEPAEPSGAEREPSKDQPAPSQPTTEKPLPAPPTEPKVVLPLPVPSPRLPLPAVPTDAVRAPGRPVYGPPDTGRSSSGDSERVGTAPNGEPLYAAAWYREPRDDELRGYLSTASGPGWGLIACRTAPDYRVEDCVGLDEYPNGSQINRAVLAAAWTFQVRPPRLGGRALVGSWVRIRIDYGTKRR